MVKKAPQPLIDTSVPNVAPVRNIIAGNSVNSGDTSLRELCSQSRALREQIIPLQKQLHDVDEKIALRHADIRATKDLASLSPEDFDDVVSGRAKLLSDVALQQQAAQQATQHDDSVGVETVQEQQPLSEHDHSVQ